MVTPENVQTFVARGQALWKSIYEPHAEKLYNKLGSYHPDFISTSSPAPLPRVPYPNECSHTAAPIFCYRLWTAFEFGFWHYDADADHRRLSRGPRLPRLGPPSLDGFLMLNLTLR